ncbi:MAG TPA: hypothetical protein VFC09_04195 [Candidatus Dormibacteraeota bacterium]|nr:hypothetical protein [Candidatus Dormibacteraeota bacterium]
MTRARHRRASWFMLGGLGTGTVVTGTLHFFALHQTGDTALTVGFYVFLGLFTISAVVSIVSAFRRDEADVRSMDADTRRDNAVSQPLETLDQELPNALKNDEAMERWLAAYGEVGSLIEKFASDDAGDNSKHPDRRLGE